MIRQIRKLGRLKALVKNAGGFVEASDSLTQFSRSSCEGRTLLQPELWGIMRGAVWWCLAAVVLFRVEEEL